MSRRNVEAKRTARERLRIERERQARRSKQLRQVIVAGSAILALAIFAAVALTISNLQDDDGGDSGSTDWEAVQNQLDGKDTDGETYADEAPANTSGKNGLVIRIGDEDAEDTLSLYEDPRCPACQSFEETMGKEVRDGIENGDYQAEYVFATFIDDSYEGTGSKNALAALGAALNVSEEAFLDYHDALYDAKNHPEESNDEYSDNDTLLDIAQSVPDLKDNKAFRKDVNNGTYAVWALRMSEKFNNTDDVSSTPTLKWNGEVIDTPSTAKEFTEMVEEKTKDSDDDSNSDE